MIVILGKLKTLIRLLLQEQSDQDLQFMPSNKCLKFKHLRYTIFIEQGQASRL